VTDLDRATGLGDVLAAARAAGFAPDAAEVVVHGLCASCARA
jgi:Fe2+ or Zn2+ uptake regulation protein